MFWNVRAIPRRTIRCGGVRSRSRPSKTTRARVGPVEPRDHVERRRLAGAVRADQARRSRPRATSKDTSVEGEDAAEAAGDVLDREQRHPGSTLRRRGAASNRGPAQERLVERGLDVRVQELEASTRTAEEAAAAVGADVGQIVKSLVFVDDDGPVLVLCAGDRRVDVARLGQGARQARADEVREATGFAIGGVPPLGHDRPLRTVVDRRCGASRPSGARPGPRESVFEIDAERLIAAIPGVEVRDVSA